MDFNLIKPNNLSFPRKCLINFLMGSLSVLSLEPINFFVVLFFTIPIYIFNFDTLDDEKKFHSKKIFFIPPNKSVYNEIPVASSSLIVLYVPPFAMLPCKDFEKIVNVRP